MKQLAVAIAVMAVATGVGAQTRNYNQEGKAFGQSNLGTSYNRATTTDPKTVPYYNENPQQKQSYGAPNLFDVGFARIESCKTEAPGTDRMANQECQAVNFLAKNPRARFQLTPNDPAIVAARNAINNAGKYADSVYQNACTTKTTRVPEERALRGCAEYLAIEDAQCTEGWVVYRDDDSNFQCEQTYKAVEILTCEKTLYSTCSRDGATITDTSTSNSGIFTAVTITPNASKTGLYDYKFDRPYRSCGSEGSAQIDFNLDEVGSGSYMTLNISNLDDTAVVAVNGYTVFAGYPNAGPQYSGDWFSRDKAAFQLGYSWTETIGQTCTNSVYDWRTETTTCTEWAPNNATFTATAKLLDYCPAGYAITNQKDFVYCNPDNGQCTNPSSNTADTMPGFFCNSEGKFLINRHEGDGTWAGSVSASMPLRAGRNSISVYWGTSSYGGACGNVLVTGQIYNVKAQCTDQWSDNCAALEERTK